MRVMSIVFALAAGATSISCFAATTPVQPSAQASASTQSGQWIPPYGVKVPEKTRAEVYQELVHAEKDGQEAYLNSTLYSHG
ncbi:protein of unknown function [Burkholderia sp. CF099]|nr:protein of unknown function [Burkholderia sp. CF099]